jgi:predicted phage tail protein/DNA polymerase IIIc chi subunit
LEKSMGAAQHLDIAGAKGGSSKPKTPVEAPDSLQSTNIASILLAVGEGEFDGTPTDRDIYLDNTPIMDVSGNVNFPGVSWEWRTGSIDQEYIKGIPAIENENTVNVELRSDNPFTRALSNTQLSRLRLRFTWPRLASQDSSGNTNGYRIEYAIDISTDGGAYVEAHRGAVDGKTTNGYQRSVSVDLPASTSGWMFRVRRITPNQNSGTVADTMTIAGYTEIIDEKLRYPNTALLYIEFDAQQFQNIPAVTVKCKAKRWPVPTNYDPVTRTYTGVWDGTFKQAWTNNPAFVTYGLCVEDRFGLGKRIKSWMVDKWEMYRIAQYCDQQVPNGQGGQEPRFLCDMNLQGRAEAWTLLRDLSAIYRGMVYWAHGSLFMQADMPRAQDIDYVFTRANVIDGEFVYGGAERNTHYSRALVSYDNPANNYDTDVIPVTDLALQRRYRDRPVEISAIGCTRASEAQRRGKWALLSNSQDRTVTFKTGMEGRIPLPGYVIPVADELVAGRPNGGRISSAAGRVVTLDRDTPIKAGDRLILNLPNGTAQARTVQSVSGRAVTVTTAYGVQPEPELQWAIDYDDLAVQLFRVLKTTRTQEGDYEITALEFNPSKFAAIDTGAKLDERPISIIPVTTVLPPASVTLTSAYAVDQGIGVNTMTISWPAVQGAVAYDVEWRKDNGNWVRVQRTGAGSVDVVGIYAGAYLARVRAVSSFDITSIWRDSAQTQLKGKEGLPPAVSFLTATPLVYGTRLKWGFPAGAEDTERTEIWQSPTTSREQAIKLGDFAYPQAEHEIHGLAAGVSFFYWARLVDRSGNVGPWYPTDVGVNGQSSSNQSEYEEYFKDKISNGALYPALREEIALISGPPDLPGSVNNRLEELDEQVTEITDQLGDAVTQVQSNLDTATQQAQQAIDQVAESARQVQQDLDQATQDLQGQIDGVSQIAKSLPYSADKTYTAGQTVLGADGKLYQASKAVPKNTSPPNTSYWTDVGQVVQSANGLAARVQTVETKVTNLEGTTTSQATQLTGLQSSLTTTNQNVTAAQQAAQAASDLAGSKGKVIVQSMAPAVADRLAQNLWIDTTGNANTPKRWSGSAWVAVTDKVATDAAAAAANALTVAQTKADASVVNNLSTRVTDAEGVISSQGQAMTGLQNSLVTTNQNVSAAQQAAQDASTLAGGKGKVIVQSAAPAAADRLAQNLWIDTTGNANTPKRWTGSAWVAVTDKVATDAAAAAANALSVAQTKADASAVDSLSTTVTQQGNTITSQGQALTGLNNSLTTTNQNVTAAQQAAQSASDLAGGKGKVLFQATAPAVADRVAQNLWIDTTGNANTPKRWNGSAWVAVTDKVATDAAAAAAAASALAQTKADASTVTELSNTVIQQGDTITAQGQALTNIQATIGNLSGENLLLDPSFSSSNGVNAQPGILVLNRNDAGVPAGAATARVVKWDVPTSTGNTYVGFTSALNVRPPENSNATQIAVAAGEIYDFELVLHSEKARQFGLWAQYYALDGSSVTHGWVQQGGDGVNISTTAGQWVKLTGMVTVPAGAVRMAMTVRMSTGDALVAYMAAPAVRKRAAQTNALASATQALDARVAQTEAGLTSQSSSIISLQSSLTTTNQNVTAAQQAAQDAANLAGGKGKVIVQSAAPAVADRLAQNLWIDTTGNANTPKRWSGTTWVAVTDKVATDAAAAAANALTVAQTKADASVVNNLSTRVSDAEGVITSQGQAMTGLQNSLSTTNQNVSAAQQAAQDASTLAGGKGKVIVQSAAPAAADRLAQNLWIDTTGNANTPKRWTGSAWVAVTDKVATDAAAAAANALSVAQTKADASAVDSLSTTVTQQGNTITSQGQALTGLNNSLTTTNQNVTAAQQAAQSASDLAGGKGKVLFQATAPAVADRVAQNLWIDTTGNANTPKRWNGSAWVAVTDKVATDAAAAAAAASALAQTKADASTVTELSNTVIQQGDTITAQGQALTNIQATIGNLSGENLLLDPSFSSSNGVNAQPGILVLNRNDAGVPAGAATARVVKWDVPTSTGNTYVGFTSALNVRPPENSNATQIAVAAGEIYDFELVLHSEKARQFGLWAQYYALDGSSVTHGWVQQGGDGVNISTTAGQWVKLTGMVTVPAGAVRMAMTVRMSTGDALVAYMAAPAVRKRAAQTNALASATQALDSRVSQTESGLTSQGSAITNLTNSLSTTNQNVTAAQQAAQAASDLAGGKGKVIIQSATPGTADRLAQNLWIDTTGNANTPKRWTGSAWVAVTDKVATDAATAAASALSQVAAKADASTVQALTNTVTQQGTTITAQGSEITNIKASVGVVSAENLLFNPGFADGPVFSGSPGFSVLARNDASVPAGAPSPRVVKWPVATSTGNNYLGFQSALNVRPPENAVTSQISVAAGEVYDFELYACSSVARQHGLWIQFYDLDGTSVGHNWVVGAGDGIRLTNVAQTWTKLTGQATVPAGCVRMAMTFRVSVGDATDVFLSSPIARKRAGQDNAQASALQSVDARVSVTEGAVSSQGSAITQLNNAVAGKADNSALQSLQGTVTQQGNTLSSQGQAVTQLQSSISGIGGSGSNLLADDYSWLTSTTLPATSVGGGVTRDGVAVPDADSGFGYQAGSSTNSFLMLSPTNNLAGWNVRIEPGVCLVSMYIQCSAATNGRISLYNGTHRYGPTLALPTTRTRVTFPVTVTDSAKVGITIYFNMSAVSGLTAIIDSVMIEKRVGDSNTPSPFVAGPSARAVSGQATAISQLNTTVNQQGTAITAQASRLDGLYVQVNPEMEGDSTGLAGATGSLVGVWTEQSARIEDGVAMGRRVDTVQSQVGGVEGSLQAVSASVQQVSQTIAGVDGKVSAMTTIKAETISDGRKVMAGLAIGSDGQTGEILAFAQRFAIVDESSGQVTLPFVVSNGQVFINQAVINQAFIQNLVLGMTLRSQAVNSQGLPLIEINLVTGAFTVRGQDGNGSTLLNNGGLYVYDANGIERTAVGRLT